MSYDIVPESAPFSAEQRAWLNGFLAGMLGTLDVGQAQGGNAVSLAAAAATLLPPAGSGTGAVNSGAVNSGAVSSGAAASELDTSVVGLSAADHDAEEESFPWHEPSLSSAQRMELAKGRPLPQRMMAAMAQLDCGSCGYVCQTYAQALANGSEKNLTLCSPGGSDTAKLLRQLQKERASQTSETSAAATPSASPTSTSVQQAPPPGSGSRTEPFIAKLKSNIPLNRTGSAKDTRHLAIDLSGTSLQYRVGDALGILPTNCNELVRQVCHAAGTAPQTPVSVDGKAVTLETVLAEKCLRSIPAELVERARDRVARRPKVNGSVATDAALVERLQHFIESDEFTEFDVIEFLEEFTPLDLSATDLIETLLPLRPRLYSIASSQSQTPQEVHLTVGRVEETVRGRARKGVASTMLADRLSPGAALRVFVQPNHGFTIPADPAAPMIMVGPGTGIAPFIAFLQQRRCDRAPGKNWLFFGDQKRAVDFLYEEQLTAWHSEGHLARLDLAFSRDSDEKVYVQQRMLENGAELFQWLESGGYFFVCGDAQRMARDVERTLIDIIARHGQRPAEAAKKYLAAMKQTKRYVCDVY